MMAKVAILIGQARTRRLGVVWAACSPSGLVATEFGVTRRRFASRVRKLTNCEPALGYQQMTAVVHEHKDYVEGRRRIFSMPIDWSFLSSDFQRRALHEVLRIPYGETLTYAQVASRIGQPRSARAVGRANATNPIPLVIPCHRVVGSNGTLRGYGGKGGLRTKAWLLEMERTCAGSAPTSIKRRTRTLPRNERINVLLASEHVEGHRRKRRKG